MSLRVQKINKTYGNALEMAIKYYSVINVLNDLYLAQRQIELIAYTSIKGNISYRVNKEEFAEMFDSSVSTVNNMIGPLRSIGLLVVHQGKYRVNPKITLPFEQSDLGLLITLKKLQNGTETNHS